MAELPETKASNTGATNSESTVGEQRPILVVAVRGGSRSDRLAQEAPRFAEALVCRWDAVYVETPDTQPSEEGNAAAALGAAAQLGRQSLLSQQVMLPPDSSLTWTRFPRTIF
jgi:K+-sensing histidine kinase KdpD